LEAELSFSGLDAEAITTVEGIMCIHCTLITADRKICVPGRFKYHKPKMEAQETSALCFILA